MFNVEKGDLAEKELYDIFREAGFTVIRMPQSGRMLPFPDLIVIKRGVFYGFEVKFSKKKKMRYSELQYDNLIEWLMMLRKEGVSVRGFIAVKINDEWEFIEIDIDVKEVYFPNENSLKIDDVIKLMKKRMRRKNIDCSIRLMGNKEDVYNVSKIVKETLEKKGFKLLIREYVMYKNKKERTEVDKTKTRIYMRLGK